MNEFYPLFGGMYTEASGWLSVQDLYLAADQDLAKSNYRLRGLSRAIAEGRPAVSELHGQSFSPVEAEVYSCFSDRLIGGSWPDDISEVHLFWIRVVLDYAGMTTQSLGPTPMNSLRPTIIPFPDHDYRQVALWFCTEWWSATGSSMHVRDTLRNKRS